MAKAKPGRIRVGVGGWTFEPWRGLFYPQGLPQRLELTHAASKLSSIEINGTYYGSQKPESFAKWHAETPDDFVFSLKGPRFTTNRRVLAEAGESIGRFFASGVMELKDKLGPVNWQFATTKKFDPADFGAFLALLPQEIEGRPIRHALEVRNASFDVPEFHDLARRRGAAIIRAGDSEYPEIAVATAPFAYLRVMGTQADEEAGYDEAGLERWAGEARALAKAGQDVFMYVISGAKERNPAAAMALIERLS